MLEFLSALFLWLTMITIGTCQLPDNFGNSYNSDIRLLDEYSLDMLNKTNPFKPNSTLRNDIGISKTSKPVPFPPKPYLDNVDVASHPPNRGFFTPPLPREHNNPFADKPTLRGSNSENSVSNRRPVPIPPPPANVKPDRDRIPIKRPDMIAVSDTKKKTINTPSLQKLPEGLNYSEPSSSPSSTTHRTNDTFDVVLPAVHNISFSNVFRILTNDKKHEYVVSNKSRLEQELKSSKTNATVKSSTTTTTPASTSRLVEEEKKKEVFQPSFVQAKMDATSLDITGNNKQVTESRSEFKVPSVQEATEVSTMPDHPEPRARHILGIAWDIHVYLIAVLFAILAVISAISLFRMRAFKWLLPYGYFFAVHSLLMVIGAVRSFFLFYDAYNISRSFSEPISRLMLNIVFPFLVCIFSLMFVFILKFVELKSDIYYARKSNFFILLVVVYVLFSVCIDLYADLTPYSSNLILLSQCLYVFLCVILGITYIIFYKYANRSSLRKQNSVYGTAFTDPLRPSLAHAIRVMLATSLLSLLMAAIQLIGMFCIYDPFNKDQPHPWLWWAFQLSVRVIEVSICFLVFWAAVQPRRGEDEKETQSHNSASGFPLFPWGATGTPRGSDHGNGDDIYPTICSTNQAIHNYTLRTGKQVYEDIFQYCNASTTPVPTHLLHTTDRRSFKKHPLDVDVRSGTLTMYPDRRPQPSPSMLIDEKGIVRFRSIADAELHAEDTFSRLHLHPPSDNYGSS